MTDEKDNALELARIAFIKAAMTIERDVRLHELTHDETNALVCAVLNTRPTQPIADDGKSQDVLAHVWKALEAYCQAYDEGTGTVYVEPQIRTALEALGQSAPSSGDPR